MKRSSATGGIEITIDDGPLLDGEQALDCCADWEVLDGLGSDASATPTSYGALLSNAVHSPSTPHPFWMSPPPPPGQPPPLLRNKRPHVRDGFSCTAPATSSSASTSASAEVEMEVQVEAEMVVGLPRRRSSLVSSATSASSASSSCDSEHREPSPEVCEECEEMSASDVLAVAPEMPPGPPPATMAPPPPLGPPPDLPLDRAELKRAVEDQASSSLRKRLRCGGVSGDQPSQQGGSTDGESSTSTSDAEEGRDTDLSGTNSQRGANEAIESGLEASYAMSPPSARWVWDRILQQDRKPANTAVLEKRMLQALDALHFGGEDKSEAQPEQSR